MAAPAATVQYFLMTLPRAVFVLARVPEGGPTDTEMVLYGLDRPGGRVTPVFSSIRTAADFLTGAERSGHAVPFDYIFRMDGARLAADFPDVEAMLDPTAEAVFGSPGASGSH